MRWTGSSPMDTRRRHPHSAASGDRGMARLHARAAPPGPMGFPLMGVFPMARRDPLAFFVRAARRYGDLVSMRLGVHRAYLLSHPDDVKRVLQDRAGAYAKGPPASHVRA